MGELKGQLEQHAAARREELRASWFDAILAEYPPETSQFLRYNTDQFANPVGHALRTMVDDVIDGIAGGTAPAELGRCLEPVIRIRSLQEPLPSRALGFVLSLKRVLRGGIGSDKGAEIEALCETLLLHAFDVYMDCRRVLFEVRHEENRRNMFLLLKNAGMVASSASSEVSGDSGGRD